MVEKLGIGSVGKKLRQQNVKDPRTALLEKLRLLERSGASRGERLESYRQLLAEAKKLPADQQWGVTKAMLSALEVIQSGAPVAPHEKDNLSQKNENLSQKIGRLLENIARAIDNFGMTMQRMSGAVPVSMLPANPSGVRRPVTSRDLAGPVVGDQTAQTAENPPKRWPTWTPHDFKVPQLEGLTTDRVELSLLTPYGRKIEHTAGAAWGTFANPYNEPSSRERAAIQLGEYWGGMQAYRKMLEAVQEYARDPEDAYARVAGASAVGIAVSMNRRGGLDCEGASFGRELLAVLRELSSDPSVSPGARQGVERALLLLGNRS